MTLPFQPLNLKWSQRSYFVNWYNPFKEHKFVIVCSKGMVTYEDSSDKKQVILHKNIVISNWLIMN